MHLLSIRMIDVNFDFERWNIGEYDDNFSLKKLTYFEETVNFFPFFGIYPCVEPWYQTMLLSGVASSL